MNKGKVCTPVGNTPPSNKVPLLERISIVPPVFVVLKRTVTTRPSVSVMTVPTCPVLSERKDCVTAPSVLSTCKKTELSPAVVSITSTRVAVELKEALGSNTDHKPTCTFALVGARRVTSSRFAPRTTLKLLLEVPTYCRGDR